MKNFSKFNIIEYIEGLILLVLGVLTFVKPRLMLTGIVFIYGVIAIIMGVVDIVVYIKIEKFTGLGPIISLVSGILSVMCGATLLVYPNAGIAVLSFLFPIWFIAHCISKLAHINVVRLAASKFVYYFSLSVNIVGIILGFLMLIIPSLSLMTMSYLIGLYLVILGIENLLIAYIIQKYNNSL